MKALILLITLSLAGLASAQDYEFYNKKLTPEQKEQAIYLEKHIMATCCFGGPIYMHGKNQRTESEKITIRRLLLEGQTTDQILDYFRNSKDPQTGKPYGNRILAAPKASETVGQVSYWMVVGFTVIGFILLALAVRKLRGRKRVFSADETLSDETLEQIESEISNLS